MDLVKGVMGADFRTRKSIKLGFHRSFVCFTVYTEFTDLARNSLWYAPGKACAAKDSMSLAVKMLSSDFVAGLAVAPSPVM